MLFRSLTANRSEGCCQLVALQTHRLTVNRSEGCCQLVALQTHRLTVNRSEGCCGATLTDDDENAGTCVSHCERQHVHLDEVATVHWKSPTLHLVVFRPL